MIASTFFSYLAGCFLGRCNDVSRYAWLVATVVIDLALLAVYKYSGMVVTTLNNALHLELPIPDVSLPLGISFYTFQALSYVINVYRMRSKLNRSIRESSCVSRSFHSLLQDPSLSITI